MTKDKRDKLCVNTTSRNLRLLDDNNQLTLLSFLYHVKVANGLPPDDIHNNFCTEPAGIIDPSLYPDISGADGGSVK